ncbi:MAG: ABC transporter ATP-binding protein [Proteobacteria bacterium]|nr:ABC transporter ATP-binding protein [Pseudomonadota bacterium]NOG61029.1 ABC transporter ATP-binding protein [Pseudomonadota bacterium]
MVPTNIVQAESLGKQVKSPEGTLTILADINLSIKQGESLAIIGISGSGKSTLLGLLAGLDIPTAGRVILDGSNLSQLDEDGRAKIRAQSIGFVFQSFHLLPGLTALENTSLPLELADIDDAKKKAEKKLEEVGLIDRIHHYPNQLSGGEQQRVAIARAFAGNPKIMFADEPTGNLDQKTAKRIIDLLFKLNKENGTTLIMVTHDNEIAHHCDRQVVIAGGQISEEK